VTERTDQALERGTGFLVWLACGLMFVGALGALRFRGRITTPQMWIGIAALPLLLHLMSSATIKFLKAFSSGLSTSLLATRGEPHSREYSEQQALVVAGRIEEAIDSYRSHIVAFPDDLEARLRLASLLAGPAGRPAEAERTWLEVREMNPSPRQEMVIGNALIDLYRRTGQRHLLKAELARFARINDGTEAGGHARRHLRQLVEEEQSGT
jgi:tetratricopeptide (TPR) repeat protein